MFILIQNQQQEKRILIKARCIYIDVLKRETLKNLLRLDV